MSEIIAEMAQELAKRDTEGDSRRDEPEPLRRWKAFHRKALDTIRSVAEVEAVLYYNLGYLNRTLAPSVVEVSEREAALRKECERLSQQMKETLRRAENAEAAQEHLVSRIAGLEGKIAVAKAAEAAARERAEGFWRQVLDLQARLPAKEDVPLATVECPRCKKMAEVGYRSCPFCGSTLKP